MIRTRTKSGLPSFVACVFVIALAAILLTACDSSPAPKLVGPAAVVDDVLRARSEGITDTAFYERAFESTALAQRLAADSAARPTTQAPTPPWKTPKVTKETTSTARVTVEWKFAKGFETWPAWTRFALSKKNGAWLIVDATEATVSVSATATP